MITSHSEVLDVALLIDATVKCITKDSSYKFTDLEIIPITTRREVKMNLKFQNNGKSIFIHDVVLELTLYEKEFGCSVRVLGVGGVPATPDTQKYTNYLNVQKQISDKFWDMYNNNFK